MDDTNPETEDVEFVRAIEQDVRWLGFDWEDRSCYASDYFERLYECAVTLVRKGLAYVDDLQGEEVSRYRGRWDEPGRDSPCRDRAVEENLDLFARMRAGEFEDGARTLRAKIDMAAPNMNMRDPTIYRSAAAPLPAGRRLDHLPDLRLHAPAVGRVRAHHALAVHAGVRGPPAALRLVPAGARLR